MEYLCHAWADGLICHFNMLDKLERWIYRNVDHSFSAPLKPLAHIQWRRGIVVMITAQLYSTKPELRFCRGSDLVCSVSEISNGESL